MTQESRPEVCEAYRELAIEWIRVVCCVESDKPLEEKQAVPYNLFCSAPLFILRHLSTKNRNKEFDDMLLALFDICYGMKRKQTLLDFLKITLSSEKDVILHAQNYQKIIDSESHFSSKVLRVYHWRRFVAFFAEKASDEGLRSQCLAKLLPMLNAFIAFVNSFITKFFKDSASVSGNVTVREKRKQSPTALRPTLIDLINMLPYLDPEPVGKASWKEMLIKKVLTNPLVPLNAELAEAAVTSLLDYHYEKDETQAILADFLGILNTIAQSNPLPGGSTGPDLAGAQFGVDDTLVTVPMDQVLRVRCLLVTNAMLRTGCIGDHLPKSLADQLHSSIIADTLQSEHPTNRLLAYQCIGAIAYAHREFAKKHMPVFCQALRIEISEIKEACVEVLSDMILQYGYSQTELWFSAADTQCPGFPLYTSLISQIDAEQSTLALETLRCLCRFVLFGDAQQPPVPQALAHLVLWYAKCLAAPEEYEHDERVAVLEKFFNAFCCDYARQKVCIQVVEEAFAVLDNADADSVFASVKRVDVSNVVVDLCKSDRLVKVTPEARSLPAHIILGEQILRLLAETYDNADLAFWSKVLQRLVISSDTQIEKLRELIALCQAASENIGEYSTANKTVELFEKRLNTAVKRAATQKPSQTPARIARTNKKAPARIAQRQQTNEPSDVDVSEAPAKQDDSSATPTPRQLMSPSRQLRSLRTRNPKPQPTLDLGDSPMDISDDSDF
ncbi:Chromosome condensation protein 3C-terminal region containing protein [Aphelenchoides avenae]|nr:Chromosome condensation protein 3C-terminal region containing protein [Aphelenchus avenae]